MEKINNLKYTIQINYTNNSGSPVSIRREINECGLEMNSTKIGDMCLSEETTYGRVLSGIYENQNTFCGYKYNYGRNNEEFLVNINQETTLETAINLINKTKMESGFLSAKMVLSAVSRNDNRIFAIKSGTVNLIKTVTAENENKEIYFVQENIMLTKTENEESFSEIKKETIFKIDDEYIISSKHNVEILNELAEIIKLNPTNYKELINSKQNSQTIII